MWCFEAKITGDFKLKIDSRYFPNICQKLLETETKVFFAVIIAKMPSKLNLGSKIIGEFWQQKFKQIIRFSEYDLILRIYLFVHPNKEPSVY